MATRTGPGGRGALPGSFFGAATAEQSPVGFNRARERASPVPSLVELASAHHEPGTAVTFGTSWVPFDVTAAGAGVELAKIVLTRGLYLLQWYVTTDDVTTSLRRFDIDVYLRSGLLYARTNGIISAGGVRSVFQGQAYLWVHERRIEGTGAIPNRPAVRAMNVEASAAGKVTIGHLAAVRLWTDVVSELG